MADDMMEIDAPTTLLMTLGVAVIAAGFLILELRMMREPALLVWGAGFCAIAAGCAIAPMRAHSFLVGVWIADGLLVIAHLLFLFGVSCFVGARITPLWLCLIVPWLLLPLLISGIDVTYAVGTLNAGLVAIATLRAAMLLLTTGPKEASHVDRRLGFVFLAHGLFYALKTGLVFEQGAFVDLFDYRGYLIHFSLFEGLMVEVLLALLMVAAVRQRLEAEIVALAERDPLTGVFNRRAFEFKAARALQKASGRSPCTLMLLDLDHFKRINDTFGHGLGDRLLVAFSRRVESLLPRGGLVARIGGEEFAVLLEETGADAARSLGMAICARFAADGANFEGRPVSATVSIGEVVLKGATDLDAALDAADEALYEAKHRGRNQTCLRWLPSPRRSESGDALLGVTGGVTSRELLGLGARDLCERHGSSAAVVPSGS